MKKSALVFFFIILLLLRDGGGRKGGGQARGEEERGEKVNLIDRTKINDVRKTREQMDVAGSKRVKFVLR